jgi:FkbM family methyltransferase
MLSANISSYLECSPDECRRIEASAFDERALGQTRIVIYGAGNLGQKLVAAVLENGAETVVGIADRNSRLWGKSIDGIPVFDPAEAASRFGADTVFVVAIWAPGHSYLETCNQLSALGCRNVVPWQILAWKTPGILPHYQFDKPSSLIAHKNEILWLVSRLADDKSKDLLRRHIQFRMFADASALPHPETNQYFDPVLGSAETEDVFIDGGAFTGDTIAAFLENRRGRFKQIWAFEPDKSNFAVLESAINQQEADMTGRIECFNAALSSRTGHARLVEAGNMSSFLTSNGANNIQTKAVDTLPCARPVTFIKLDVEGWESEALEGSKETITRDKPNLAVCVYHRPNDLWDLPKKIDGYRSDYQYYLRSYDYDGLELVLYCAR